MCVYGKEKEKILEKVRKFFFSLMTLGRCVLLYFWTQEVTVRIYKCLAIKFMS